VLYACLMGDNILIEEITNLVSLRSFQSLKVTVYRTIHRICTSSATYSITNMIMEGGSIIYLIRNSSSTQLSMNRLLQFYRYSSSSNCCINCKRRSKLHDKRQTPTFVFVLVRDSTGYRYQVLAST
jgi:hypothetical protein